MEMAYRFPKSEAELELERIIAGFDKSPASRSPAVDAYLASSLPPYMSPASVSYVPPPPTNRPLTAAEQYLAAHGERVPVQPLPRRAPPPPLTFAAPNIVHTHTGPGEPSPPQPGFTRHTGVNPQTGAEMLDESFIDLPEVDRGRGLTIRHLLNSSRRKYIM
jgi:hypothetical protein